MDRNNANHLRALLFYAITSGVQNDAFAREASDGLGALRQDLALFNAVYYMGLQQPRLTPQRNEMLEGYVS